MNFIMTYKILHSIVHLINKDHIFTMSTNPTRTNGLKLYKHRNKLEVATT